MGRVLPVPDPVQVAARWGRAAQRGGARRQQLGGCRQRARVGCMMLASFLPKGNSQRTSASRSS